MKQFNVVLRTEIRLPFSLTLRSLRAVRLTGLPIMRSSTAWKALSWLRSLGPQGACNSSSSAATQCSGQEQAQELLNDVRCM